MKSKLLISLFFISICYQSTLAVERIENFDINRKEVQKVYLSFSKAILFRFPEAIEEVRLGLPNFYEAEISKRYKKELTVFLKENTKIPTNIIIRTSSANLYAFDLVPSDINNQDIIFVDKSFYPVKEFNKTSSRKTLLSNKKEIFFEN